MFILNDDIVADGCNVWIPSTGAVVNAAVRDIVRRIVYAGGTIVGIGRVGGGEIVCDSDTLEGGACILESP